MEKRIELEKRGREPKDIDELNLDNCRSTNIVGLTDEFTNLQMLSLINVGLTSLKGFPKLPNLQRLELSDNRISNGLNLLLTSPLLDYLNLSGNKISDLETLQPLKELKNLTNLDLFNNDATLVDGYRQKVFSLIKSLKYLDGFDENEREADSEEDEVNGNEDDSDEEEDEDEDDEELEEEEIGLQAVYNQTLEDDSDEGDYEAEEDEEDEDEVDIDEDEDEDDAEQESPTRGKKRKHEDGEAN